MPPDLNSLPPSRSSSTSSSFPQRNPPASPGAPSPAAAPAAGPVNPSTTSPRASRGSSIGRVSVSERRRSNAGLHVNFNEPGITVPGNNNGDVAFTEHRGQMGQAFRTASPTAHGSPLFATADPHHQRAPSLGELHQELEQEQEAQVNRLLQLIRIQQAQLQQYQQNNPLPNPSAYGTAVIDDNPSPASERSAVIFPPIPPPAGGPVGGPVGIPGGPVRDPVLNINRLSISSLSNRRSSHPSSQGASPNLRPRDASHGPDGMEAFPSFRESSSRRSSRDEAPNYAAEAAMLQRENLMLRQRIRQLERRINDLDTGTQPTASTAPGSAPASAPASAPVSDPASGQEATQMADPQTAPSSESKD